jgi:YD repeat-containing protein
MSFGDNLTLRTYQFESSVANRVSNVLLGDGDNLTYEYDTRGNITKETHTPKAGSTLDPTIRTANYDATCTNPVKCNKPNWMKDAMENQTDYEYDAVHGGLLKITLPPPALGGVRPQIRQTFAQRYAWYKNSSGNIVQSPSPIWVLTAKKHCRKTAALSNGAGCTTPSDEVTTTYEYGPTSGPNNLYLRGLSVTADGVTLRTCYGYDFVGNRVSETLPKAGLASCP